MDVDWKWEYVNVSFDDWIFLENNTWDCDMRIIKT